jgi:hypothetical protein
MPEENENSGEGTVPVTARIAQSLIDELRNPPAPEAPRTRLEAVGDWFKRYLGSIVLDKKGSQWSMSLGRVAFLAVLIQFFVLWNTTGSEKVPGGLLEVFGVLAAYTFGSKITSLFGDKIRISNGTNDIPEQKP